MLIWKSFASVNYLFFSIFLITYIKSDKFTSLVDLEAVLETEKEIPALVDEYIKAERKRLQEIKRLAKSFKQSQFPDEKSEETYLDNPINIFHLVKRLNVDTRPIMHLMNTTKVHEVIKKYKTEKKNLVFPDNKDFAGVVDGLVRVATVYNLTVSDIAKGEFITGMKAIQELTALDCYDIAQQLFDEQKYTKAIKWFEEARNRQLIESPETIDSETVYEFLSYTYFLLGHTDKTVEVLGEYLEQDPSNKRLLESYEMYSSQLDQNNDGEIVPKAIDKSTDDFQIYSPRVWIEYRKLCQEVYYPNLPIPSQMKCYYSRNKSPYLMLQPAKMEDIYLNPWIVIFHDVLSDKEIEMIKSLSSPKLSRATVIIQGGKSAPAPYRISKSAWLEDRENATVYKITKRIQELTRLETFKAGEDLQVVNYGIGGHYEPHHDYDVLDEHPVTKTMGQRIATFLIYLTDVPAGGGTVFPQLGIGVHPEKGSAVFWYNLFKTGEVNSLTEHAACPVAAGIKWVANKWMHEMQQEFRRPCGLSQTSLFDESPIQRNDFR